MKLSHNDLKDLMEIALQASEKAAHYIQNAMHGSWSIQTKESELSHAAQIFTEVDQNAQDIICTELQPTFEKYDLGVLTEESPDDKSRLVKDYFWCVDPLDGSLAFTEKQPGYAISIALVNKAGTPTLAVVANPTTGDVYHAIKGQGLFKNNALFENKPSSSKFTWVCDPNFEHHPEYDKFLTKMQIYACKNNWELQIINIGGAVLNAIWVMEQIPAVYFKLPKSQVGGGSIWDFAATACFFVEAGFINTNFNDNPLELNNSQSTYMHSQGVFFSSDIANSNLINELKHKKQP
jgi:fructose-1,6-bisphosphatase/inositol monophosphatase family enzyme